MPIHNYCGLPGSGKSYSVVDQVVLPALRSGRRLVTNLPLNMPLVYSEFPSAEIELFDLPSVENSFFDLDANSHRRGSIWIIDECWKRWPQGTRVDAIPACVGAFFAEHRHFVGEDGFSTEIVLVCQSINQISAFIRELVDTTYMSRKLDKLGAEDRFRVDIYAGPQALTRPDREQMTRQVFGKYDPQVYRFYKSHTRNDTSFGAGNEKNVGRSTSIFRSPIFVIGGPAALLALYVSYSGLAFFFRDRTPNVEAPVIPVRGQVLSAGVSAPRPGVSSHRIAAPPLSTRWRLVGVVWRSPRDGLAVVRNAESGVERVIPLQGHCSTVRGLSGGWQCVVDGELVTVYSGDSNVSTLPL